MPGRLEIAYIDSFVEPGNRLRVRISTDGGRVVAFTVQYETLVGDRFVPVVRYDSQHESPHRDTLNRRGDVIDKLWIHSPMEDALQFAIDDVREKWGR